MRREDGHRGADGDHDAESVESVLDELYTTPPSDFVPRRTEHAAAARAAGRGEDARRIRAARRPTLAAWAANLLTRFRPEESRRFLDLGQALREAYRTLDADGLKELSAQRRSVVSALSRQAAELADEAGHRLSEAARREVESTLQAVLADPGSAARWAGGHLEGALTPPSEFPSGTVPAEPAPRERPSLPKAPPPGRAKDELAERRRKRQEELTRAEQAAERAARQARDRRAEHADADASLRRTGVELHRAREEMSAAEQRLRQARQELERAEREQRESEERERAAAHALDRAEREAHAAAQKVNRLAGRAKSGPIE
ncbi:hypothetical protein ACP4I1_35035 [Streptomyces sp. WG4]|uniref:hypothetical protein n=1 Tax=Streptomyces sp. WG4 TaxID=3417649 RepID=UPI003CE90D5E